MAKRPDDNLEKFFLNRVDDYKIDYREGDWKNLNEMLDAAAAMKAAALKQKIIWIGSGALLMISIILLLWMSQNLTGLRPDNKETKVESGVKDDSKVENKAEPIGRVDNKDVSDQTIVDEKIIDNNKIIPDENAENNDGNNIDNNNSNQAFIQLLPSEADPSISEQSKLDSGSEQNKLNRESIQNKVKSEPEQKLPGESDKNKLNPNLVDKNTSQTRTGIKKMSDSKDEKQAEGDQKVVKSEIPLTIVTSSQGISGQVTEDDNTTAAKDDLPADINAGNIGVAGESADKQWLQISLKQNEWNLLLINPGGISLETEPKNDPIGLELRKNYAWNISVAADNSAVGMSDFDGPSLRLGLALEFFLTPRVSFVVGANYSAKNYTAYGREYTPTYGFWTNGVVPDQTLGKCNVLDIPANLTYYIPNGRGQAVFLRAGLSSWLMLEEHYYFSYESNDPNLIKYWGGENENHHYLSIVNLSAGFEHELSNKFSVLAEPYLNIPMGGVGFGKVHLYSAGMKFTMKINHFKLMPLP